MYINKYIKYKNKYLKYKSHIKLHGGNCNESQMVTNDNFMKDCIKIPNSGTRNCGIMVCNNNKLIKCEYKVNKEDFKSICKINKFVKIFPDMYDLYIYDNKEYISMMKMNGDITNLLHNEISNIVLKNMTELNEKQKKDIFFIFNEMLPDDNKNDPIIWNNIIGFLYKNQSYIKEYEKQYINSTDHIIKNIKFNVELNKVRNFVVSDVYTPSYINKCIDKLNRIHNQKLNESTVNINMYNTFIQNLNNEIVKIYPELRRQIILLKLILLKYGYTYFDNKFDNFGYTLHDKWDNHLGIKNGYIVDNQYLKIRFLDIGGFIKCKNIEASLVNIINEYNTYMAQYTIYGTTKNYVLGKNIFTGFKDISLVTKEIFLIMTNDYKLQKIHSSDTINNNITIDDFITFLQKY